jgi:Protein-disulfide isomerase
MSKRSTSPANPGNQPQPDSRRQRLREEQQRLERERRTRTILMAVAGVAVLATVIWAVFALVRSVPSTASAGSVDESTVVIGKSDAKVRVDVFQDFMCPYCGLFERSNGEDLKSMVDAGTIQLVIHPMSFLDEQSGTARYSTRAANALFTVYKAQPEVALAFNAALYANQPAEGTSGPTDDELKALATGVGVSQAVADSFTTLANEAAVVQATQSAFAAGVNSTPTVKINGVKFTGDATKAGAVKAAVEAASK